MKVGVVIVTYLDRSHYFERVINRLVAESYIQEIVLVTNGIAENSFQKLKSLKKRFNKIKTIDLNYNSGSANGFKIGIQHIIQKEIEYVWLLDDDNLPHEDALDVLLKSLKETSFKEESDALLSYRPQREKYKFAIQQNAPYLMLGSRNSFLGFNLVDKIKLKNKSKLNKNIRLGKVAVAPYGGLFFHKNLIKRVGLPNERYFLYADDLDFTFRITNSGGKIVLILDSIVEDLETSFHLKKTKSILHNRFLSTNSKEAIFYSVRNNIIFEKTFVENKLLYLLNKWIYIVVLFLMLLINIKHLWKFFVIIKAMIASKKKLINA